MLGVLVVLVLEWMVVRATHSTDTPKAQSHAPRVAFGDVVQAPPKISVVPKVKARASVTELFKKSDDWDDDAESSDDEGADACDCFLCCCGSCGKDTLIVCVSKRCLVTFLLLFFVGDCVSVIS